MLEMEEIPRPEAAEARTIEAREGTPADVAKLPGDELVLVAAPPDVPEGELLPAETGWRFAAPTPRGGAAIVGASRTRPSSSPPPGDRPVLAHDAKALGEVPANLAFDTEIAAFLLDPARRGFPLDELAEERGIAVVSDDLQAQRAGLDRRARRPPARADRRARARRTC